MAGGVSRDGGRVGARRQGAYCSEEARQQGRSGFSPAVFLAGRAGGWGWGHQAGQAQPSPRGAPSSPAHTLTLPPPRQATTHRPPSHTLQAEGSQSSGPWLVDPFGLLQTGAEFLQCLLDPQCREAGRGVGVPALPHHLSQA